jgi:hypothetical protein
VEGCEREDRSELACVSSQDPIEISIVRKVIKRCSSCILLEHHSTSVDDDVRSVDVPTRVATQQH